MAFYITGLSAEVISRKYWLIGSSAYLVLLGGVMSGLRYLLYRKLFLERFVKGAKTVWIELAGNLLLFLQSASLLTVE